MRALLFCFVAACAKAPAPSQLGECSACHAAIASEHDASFHAVAFTDRTFQESLSLEDPKEHAFCIGCHAPAGAKAGVGCGSCHTKPHEKEIAVSCATCHEFAFDDTRAELVQKTESEHQASAFAGVACTSCHMPKSGGHANHHFVSGHDPSRIASAIQVTATRAHDAVSFTIRADVGHAFPTGDMFRRARLEVFADNRDGAIVADAERTFGRTWTGDLAGRRTQATDTRIRGAWSETIPMSGAIARVRWQLIYERILAVRGPHARIASRDVIAEGVLEY